MAKYQTYMEKQVEHEYGIREQSRLKARVVVAGAARDTDDAKSLLDALGLLDDGSSAIPYG